MKVLNKDYGKGNVCDTDSTAGRDGNIFFWKNSNTDT